MTKSHITSEYQAPALRSAIKWNGRTEFRHRKTVRKVTSDYLLKKSFPLMTRAGLDPPKGPFPHRSTTGTAWTDNQTNSFLRQPRRPQRQENLGGDRPPGRGGQIRLTAREETEENQPSRHSSSPRRSHPHPPGPSASPPPSSRPRPPSSHISLPLRRRRPMIRFRIPLMPNSLDSSSDTQRRRAIRRSSSRHLRHTVQVKRGLSPLPVGSRRVVLRFARIQWLVSESR